MSSITTFILIWGVWLITPVLVDGFEAIGRLLIVRSRRRTRVSQEPVDDTDLPTVTVIVPAHNEAAVIDRCLNSVKAQDYPSDKLEIIVIDDGSTDDTAGRVENHVNGNGNGSNGYRLRGKPIKVGPFDGKLTLIKNGHGGKAHALNAGIEASTGQVVVNIDSDVVLAFDAVRRIAESFHRHPEMGAATGNIEIDWETLEARDDAGEIILDENGDIMPKKLGAMERFLAKCQFLEYLASFDLGRRSQAETGTMYTLAGACSAFRRDVIAGGIDAGYSNATVSEDTCLTFDLHRRDVYVGFIEDAKVYLEPVIDWDALYAQRVRWTRGQLEVCGLNEDLIGKKERGTFSRFAVPKMLLFDHTLAFPRLVWAPLLLFFPLIGYSWRIVTLALVAMYLFYLLIEIVNTLATFSIADAHSRDRIERCGWALLGLPVYRFVVFHFRFSGFLVTLTEEQKWTMAGPMQTAQSDMQSARLRSIEFVTGVLGAVAVPLGRVARLAWTLVGPLMFAVMIVVDTWLDNWKRNS